MPRNHNAGPSTLRNRNRVTNKTRLKVIKESIDADPIVLDEDEEKARVVSTAGVDAEDANEHHLQAVLSAAASRHHQSARSRTSTGESSSAPSAAYIPTPDSTGIVDNYAELYPSDRWRDPSTYVKTSDTVEEAIADALTNGFIYYMDERDKEWLDKNNEEARGEGTSAQGAVQSSTRSGRSARKGKEPVEGPQAISMSEDEFELVMAVFEKVTHEKTPFLHHSLEQGSTQFPPFLEYQHVFANDLHLTLFALATVPSWVPAGPQLLKVAKVVYPHWSKRRQERGGHPIIPIVNLDETDTKNESYICFRRREIKAVRKTRAQQATYGDKMQRLQTELLGAVDIARLVMQREAMKKDTAAHSLSQADARFKLVDLKRKFPALGTKEDEELFYDKERVSKRPKLDAGRLPLKTRTGGNGEYSPLPQEPLMRPRDRRDMIQKQVDEDIARRKEKDHHWEDLVDNPFQPTPSTYASRLWKTVTESQKLDHSPSGQRATRLRVGRGGRMLLDRRSFAPRPAPSPSDSEDEETRERLHRLQERWRFDDDDAPAVGSKGADEQNRILVDDFDLRYLPYRMSLMNEIDHHTLSTDCAVTMLGSDGRAIQHIPFKLGAPSRREQIASQRQVPGSTSTSGTASSSGTPRQSNGISSVVPSTPPNGQAISMPVQVKNMPSVMQPPAGVRVASGGPPRPASTSLPVPTPSVPSQMTPVNAMNGVTDTVNTSIAQPDNEVKLIVPAKPNGLLHPPPQGAIQATAPVVDMRVSPAPPNVSPSRPRSQNQHTNVPVASNFQFPVNGFSAHLTATTPYSHPSIRANGLNSAQQLQAMKAPFASMTVPHDLAAQVNAQQHMRTPTSYMAAANGANYSAQIVAARQMHWVATVAQQQQHLQQQQVQMQRTPSLNLVDANGLDTTMAAMLSPPLPLPNASPSRVASSNGSRSVSLKPGVSSPAMTHAMTAQGRASPANAHMTRLGPHGHTSPPHMVSPSLTAAQVQSSPSRPPQSTLPSPSLQTRQAVGGSGAVGY